MRTSALPARPIRSRLIASVALAAAFAIGADACSAQTAPAAAASPSGIRTLDRSQLDALLANPARVLIVDVRRPDEISTIGGFPTFFSVQSGDIERSIASIPRDRQIVTVSNHAHRAVHAAEVLKSRGYRIAGAAGAQDYEAQGGTLVGRKSPALATARPAGPGEGAPAPEAAGTRLQ